MRQARAAAGACLAAVLAFVLAALLAPLPAQAQAPAAGPPLAAWDITNSRAEAAIRREDGLDAVRIASLREQLEAQRAVIRAERDRIDERAQPVREQLAALGPAPAEGTAEAEGVASERARLSEDLAAIEADAKRIDLALARTGTLLGLLAEMRARRFANDLLTAGPSPLLPATWTRALTDAGVAVSRIVAEMRRVVARGEAEVVRPLVLIGVGLLLGLVLRRLAVGWLLGRMREGDSFLRSAAIAVGIAMARLTIAVLAVLLLLGALRASGLLGTYTATLIAAAARGALIVIGAYVFTGLYFAPRAPQLRLSGFPDDAARRATGLTIRMAALFALDMVLTVIGDRLGLAGETLSVINLAVLAAGGWTMWGLARVLGEVAAAARAEKAEAAGTEGEDAEAAQETMAAATLRLLRLLFRAVAILAPALALAGYYAGSRYAFYPVVGTTALLGVYLVISRGARAFVDSRLAPEPGAAAAPKGWSRLRLLPVALGFVLICAATPALVLIWGGDQADIAALWGFLWGGFRIGDAEINLADAMTLILVFAVGYTLTRGVQNVVRRSVLPNTGMDTGATAAVTAGIGYAGVILSALAAISSAGLDLSNLALVVGALSVGIGLGLQNIVSNFVSGIILLIERPIKVGDWVELPSGQGYVKKINVRATEIQTFDRSSLFVPNSELISGPVTNWTHENSQGRIIVKVGVAYGSDVRKVEKILLAIAEAHPMMMRRPGPYVVFAGFGADSLDFEIRGVLRDVNWILNVRSDLHFEIYRRFTEEGVGIPFRQTDVHLNDPGALGAALGAGFARGMRGEKPGDDGTPDTREGETPP